MEIEKRGVRVDYHNIDNSRSELFLIMRPFRSTNPNFHAPECFIDRNLHRHDTDNFLGNRTRHGKNWAIVDISIWEYHNLRSPFEELNLY